MLQSSAERKDALLLLRAGYDLDQALDLFIGFLKSLHGGYWSSGIGWQHQMAGQWMEWAIEDAEEAYGETKNNPVRAHGS